MPNYSTGYSRLAGSNRSQSSIFSISFCIIFSSLSMILVRFEPACSSQSLNYKLAEVYSQAKSQLDKLEPETKVANVPELGSNELVDFEEEEMDDDDSDDDSELLYQIIPLDDNIANINLTLEDTNQNDGLNMKQEEPKPKYDKLKDIMNVKGESAYIQDKKTTRRSLPELEQEPKPNLVNISSIWKGFHQPSASNENSKKFHTSTSSTNNLNSVCAVQLNRGICISFGDVEEAASQARQRLDFRLSSSQLRTSEPTEETINTVGELNELTTKLLARKFRLDWMEVATELPNIDIRRTSLWADCPIIYRVSPLCTSLNRYRTHTGLCNNLLVTNLGSSNMPFLRMLPGDYGDGIGEPRRASGSGRPLPPVRLVVLNLHPNIEMPSVEHSTMFMAWGQLINHDVAMASGAREGTGHGDPCCPRLNYRGICMPIEIGDTDPIYSSARIRCHEFKRSIAGLRPGCSLGPRTQTNTITTFIDVSFVYGSSKSMTRDLRHDERGLLQMWDIFASQGLKPLLPAQRDSPDLDCVGRDPRNGRPYCFRSGDVRTNQHIQLVTLHTIHARQHNRLAMALGQLNPHWTHNRIYHEARHIHIAMVQHILLSEYLPALLGPKLIKQYNLTESPIGSYWDHYDPTLNPGISQAFAAAAFRQGHTRVSGQVFRFDVNYNHVRSYPLRDLYRQPWALYEPGNVDQFMLGMLAAPAASYDPFISLELSGHLLQMPNERLGLDLASMNLQRARDQGVPGYNAFRDWCGLGRVNTFEDLLDHMNTQSVAGMQSLYESVDDIDLFSGGVSEFALPGSQVGPTFGCIIGRQFETLRAADRFWFESSVGPNSFTIEQLNSIKQISLARLLCSNSDGIVTIQQQALLQAHPVFNPRTFCQSLPELDLGLWYEPPGGPIINPATGR